MRTAIKLKQYLEYLATLRWLIYVGIVVYVLCGGDALNSP